jgi:methylmalonyl-CoA/ethylmalonyl-CoA epimerase
MITRVHHVAIAVRDLDAGLRFWRDVLGLPELRSAELADQRVRAALLACGSCEVELITPTAADTGVARFLEARGEALHHLCFESDDVERDVRRFIATGVDMIDGRPRPGLAGAIAFLHPRACAGLLVELATPPAHGPLPEAPVALAAVHARVEDVTAAAQRCRDLFGLQPGLAGPDRAFVQLGIAGVTLQLSPVGAGFTRPGFTAIRLCTPAADVVAERLGAQGVAVHRTPVGFTVGPDETGGAPLILQPTR